VGGVAFVCEFLYFDVKKQRVVLQENLEVQVNSGSRGCPGFRRED